MRPISPYHAPGFYDKALQNGRHRDIVGGRWDETGRAQMAILQEAGLQPHHHLLDIGAGSLRLGCKAVPYLEQGHYWATDLSAALMRRGHETELADPSRLSPTHLVEDTAFGFDGIPPTITHALCFAVFTHLPRSLLDLALTNLRGKFPALEWALFTTFIAPPALADAAHRQPDGVVTHPDRAPYHHTVADVTQSAAAAGFTLKRHETRLPRGQTLFQIWPDHPACPEIP